MSLERRNYLWQVSWPIVIALSAVLYLGALFGGLVWDDYGLVDGSAIGGGKSFLACFTQPFLHNFFRPLVSVTFYVERHLWHNHPLGYHVTNLLLHVLTTGLLMLLLREAFRSRGAALVGALLFVLHPVQVGAVAWIGGRTDALSELWIVIFAWLLVRAARSDGDRRALYVAGSAAAYTLALFTKEQALALLPLVPLAFSCWKPEQGTNRLRSGLVAAIPFAMAALLFVVMGYFLGMPRPGIAERSFVEAVGQVGRIATYYALVLFVPTPQWAFTYSLGELERAGWWTVASGYVVIAAALYGLIRLRKTSPAAIWFLALALLSLAPVSGIVPLPFLLVAPYRAGVAGIGMAAVLGWWLTTRVFLPLYGHMELPKHRVALRWTTATLSAVCLWHAGLTTWCVLHWQSEVPFYETIARYDPQSTVARFNLGYRYAEEGRSREAAEQYETILRDLFRSEAWRERVSAMAAIRQDRHVLARAAQNQGTRDDPRYFLGTLLARLGVERLKSGDPIGSRAAYETGEAVSPRHPEVNVGLGYLSAERNDDAEAMWRYRMALAANPHYADAHRLLGQALARQRQWPAARDAFAAWLREEPASQEARQALMNARRQLGEVVHR